MIHALHVPSRPLVPLLGIPPKKRNPVPQYGIPPYLYELFRREKRDLWDETSPTDPSVWRGGEQTRPNDR